MFLCDKCFRSFENVLDFSSADEYEYIGVPVICTSCEVSNEDGFFLTKLTKEEFFIKKRSRKINKLLKYLTIVYN